MEDYGKLRMGAAWSNASVNLDKQIPVTGIWKSLCIGTDFEGYIDPVNEYATALQFKQFKADLRSTIQTEIFDRNLTASYLIPNGKTADDLAHDVCIGNVLDFLKRNF